MKAFTNARLAEMMRSTAAHDGQLSPSVWQAQMQEAADRLDPPAQVRRTVDVRVALAVDSSGFYRAFGESGTDDATALYRAGVRMSGPMVVFLTATLPLPSPPDHAAEIELPVPAPSQADAA